MKSYSQDLRERVLQEEEAGSEELAKRFKISKRTVDRWRQRYRVHGELRPRQRGGYLRSRLADHEKTLRQWIRREPDLTLSELVERCVEQLGVVIGKSAMANRIEKLGLSFKKNDTRQRARALRREKSSASVARKAKGVGHKAPGLP
jgi:transposase